MNQDTFPSDTLVKEVEDFVADQPQENGKRKRQMSEKQLKALAEGRKKRWLKKQETKEEPPTASESEESTEQSSSDSEESKTETETETQTDYPSTAEESGEGTSSSEEKSTSETVDSSDSEEESESESEEEEPPSPPVLKRQKASYKEKKNERAAAKMLKYIQARAQPYFNHMYV